MAVAACRGDYACAVSYYGSMIPDLANEQPRCPVICHIGEKDTSLPAARIADLPRGTAEHAGLHV